MAPDGFLRPRSPRRAADAARRARRDGRGAPGRARDRRRQRGPDLPRAGGGRRPPGRRGWRRPASGRGDRVGVRIPSGTAELYTAILAVLAAGRRVRAGGRGRPRRARADRVPRGRRRAGAHRGRPPRRRAAAPRRPGSTTTRGSSSRAARRARPRAWPSRTGPPRRSSTPRRGCSCRAHRSGRATACSPACRSRSTRAARRCGSRGRTAPASCPRRARWSAPAWTSGRGSSRRGSPSSRPCRRSPGCGAPRSWPACGCSSSAARRARPSWPRGWSAPGREVWNTYGPTEATVVACAALLTGEGPVRIGHALDGWDLAVVGPDGQQVGGGRASAS